MQSRSIAVLIIGISLAICASAQRPTPFNNQPETAKEALRRHHVDLTPAALTDALRNTDPEVRELAAQVLTEDGTDEAFPAIREAMLAETVATNRVNMAFFLAKVGDTQARGMLKTLCSSPDQPDPIRMLAAIDMRYLQDDACLSAVLAVLKSGGEPDSRMQALSLVPSFKTISERDPKIVELLASALRDPTPGVRMAASSAIGTMGLNSAAPYLEAALAREQNDSCRFQMAADLNRLTRKREPK